MGKFILTNKNFNFSKARNIKLSLRNKKAQAWSLDVVIACIIFTVGLMVLYVYAVNYTNSAGVDLEKLFYEGNNVAELLLSNDNGVVSHDIINQTKLENFYNTNYKDNKKSFGVTSDFYFSIDGMKINNSSIQFIGKLNQSSVISIVKVTRFTIYENKPVKLEVYSWK